MHWLNRQTFESQLCHLLVVGPGKSVPGGDSVPQSSKNRPCTLFVDGQNETMFVRFLRQ